MREFLQSRTPQWLVDELIGAARSSPLLRARLEAAAGAEPVVDVSRILARLDRAADAGDYVHDREAASFGDGIRTELDAVEELRAEGFAAAAIEVLEHAIELLEEARRCASRRCPTPSSWPSGSRDGRSAATARSSWTAQRRTPMRSANPAWPDSPRSLTPPMVGGRTDSPSRI